ncbi:MAG: DUF1330 domain-containing protein [Paracoccaceae bacterium]
MAALWITRATITDPERYARYAALAPAAIAAYGGEFLVRGGTAVQIEGEGRPRNVVVRFPSVADAQACYNSAAYQEALAYAEGASERELVIVEMVDPA